MQEMNEANEKNMFMMTVWLGGSSYKQPQNLNYFIRSALKDKFAHEFKQTDFISCH